MNLGIWSVVIASSTQGFVAEGQQARPIQTVPPTVYLSNSDGSPTQKAASLTALQASPTAAAVAFVPSQKLTDALTILGGFTNATVNVIVSLAPPQVLSRTDFSSKHSLAVLHPEIRRRQQEVLDAVPASDVKVGFRYDNVAGFSAEVSLTGLQALQNHAQVVSIEPVRMLQAHLAQGITLIHGMTYRSTFNGAGLAIAICDTGVDYTHARLGGGGFPNSKVLGGYDFGDNDGDPIPNTQAHGTCCAGIAAGDPGTVGDYIGGVAYNAKLYALKITAGTTGSATTAAMVSAWDWCVTHKNDNPSYPIMVISTSFGGGQYFSTCDSTTPSMTTAANNAVAAGITVLAFSGNDGFCDSLAWPACISGVISVGAVYDASFGTFLPCISSASCAPTKTSTTGCSTGYYATDQTAADAVSSYANVASFLTLLAPGNQCYTLDITGAAGYASGDYYDSFGGTSAACPYAAGAAACLQSAAKAITGNFLSPQEVKNRLITYGDNVTDTKVAITKPRVNLQGAIESLGIPGLSFVAASLSGGNGNQNVDPNECNDVRVMLRNDGTSTLTNIAAVLATASPGVSVVQAASTYPSLAPGASATNTVAFTLSTTPAFACGSPVTLSLVTSYGGGAKTNSFSLSSGSSGYVITPSAGAAIVPGDTDVGNHGNNVTTGISLPFSYTFYGQSFNSATLSGNGNLQFTSVSSSSANACLPVSSFNNAIFAHWDHLRTDGLNGTAQGIYTSTSGASPNRIFNIEWRASYYASSRRGNTINFEVRLYENQSRFDLIYGTLNGTGSGATVGAQKDTGSDFAQFECSSGGLNSGLQLTFQQSCPDGGGQCSAAAANFTGSVTNGAKPLTVSFTNTSTGATNYGWDFGDGKTSTATNPANTYTNAGSYTVQLTAIGLGGTNRLVRTNYIVVTNAPPPPVVAAFAAAPTNGLAPLAVLFTNSTTGATNYSWDFGDGKISSATNAANTYTNAGSYTVRLTAIGPAGTNVLARTNYLVVTNAPPPPVLPAFAAGPTNGLVPLAVSFTNLSTGATNYNWSFGDGHSSTNANPANTYSNAGTYTISLTAIGAGGTNSVTRTNYLTATNAPPPPVAPNFVAAPTNGLAPLTAFFTNASSGATNYVWVFGDGHSATNTNPANIYANAGTYTVSLTAIGAGGTNTFTRTNYIVATNVPPPPVVPDFVAAPTNGIAPLTVNFTNLSAGAIHYAWDFGDGNTGTNDAPANTYTNAGIYTVSLTAIGAGGTNSLGRTNYVVVISPARLVIFPASVDFGLVATDATAQATLVVSNAGAATLNGSATISPGVFATGPATSFELEAAGWTNLVISFKPAGEGSFSNAVVVASNGGISTNALAGRAINPFLILSPGFSGANFSFSFATLSGFSYLVQSKDSLSDPVWQVLQTVPGDGTVKTVTLLISSADQRFYRLSVE